ncbi:MAG: NAD-dependent epimerase/dehydratase family protein [Vibrio gallaecicus]
MASILIIGGGWLGKPVCQSLIEKGMDSIVTKTTELGQSKCINQGIPCEQFQFDHEHPTKSINELSALLANKNISIIIGCFPPGFRKGNGEEYADYWHQLITSAKNTNVVKVIMVSSTTVYPSRTGVMHEEDASEYLATNNDEFSSNAKTMLRAEQHVIDSGLDYSIVRCSGLIGPERHPSRFASKLKQVSTLAPANMLHLRDAIGAVSFCISSASKEIVNATTPTTVSKAEFYQAALASAESNDPLPPKVDTPDKLISPEKILKLGYQFYFQSTLDALYE